MNPITFDLEESKWIFWDFEMKLSIVVVDPRSFYDF